MKVFNANGGLFGLEPGRYETGVLSREMISVLDDVQPWPHENMNDDEARQFEADLRRLTKKFSKS